jgi:quercetin dioxygenase-like cupin family protein
MTFLFIIALPCQLHLAGRLPLSPKSRSLNLAGSPRSRTTEKEGNAMRMKLLALAMSFMVLPALGQTTLRATPDESFKFVSHDEITHRLMTPWPHQVYASAFMDDHEYFFVEFVKRLDHGNQVEQHTHWIDQTTVLSGEAILTYGGTIRQRQEISPGEFRGTEQSGAKTLILHPGDFVLIPPGIPHHFDAAKGGVLNYVVYKHRV